MRVWNRLVSLPAERLTRKIFMWDRVNNHPWSREVAVILTDSDFNMSFRNNLQCNLISVKEKMFMNYTEAWKEDIWRKPKLRHYILFKYNFGTEPYVHLNLKRRQRSLCAQLRFGVLPLAIEVGRFKGTPDELRLCEFCDFNLVEDELHFILYCPLYDDLRKCMFKTVPMNNADIFWKSEGEILSWIFENEIFVFSRFIEKAWLRRQCVLYPMN